MQEYVDKKALISEIRKTAGTFIKEFDEVAEVYKDTRFDDVDRTPQEIIAYQLGWMNLIREWDSDELNNTVAPFTSFRGKIRKWKKLRADM